MRKRGNSLGFWFFETVVKTGGLKPAYGFLYPVCLHYLFFDAAARRGAAAYIRRRFPNSGNVKRIGQVYKLLISKGKNLIDRYVHQADETVFSLQKHGFEQIAKLDPEQGFVLLTAHTGNWQIAMTALEQMNRTVHLLMRPEDNPAVQKSLRIQEGSERIKIISVDGPMGGMVETMQALEKGDVVSIMGDRPYGRRSVPVGFFGAEARFPCAAFLIAAGAQCPVVTLLSSKADTRSYHVDVADCFTPQWNRSEPKEAQLQRWTQRFASVLESWLQDRPFQCFLFHDIWESPS
jgi:predicted LPLAT superfamily acyltransferase